MKTGVPVIIKVCFSFDICVWFLLYLMGWDALLGSALAFTTKIVLYTDTHQLFSG